MGCSCFCLRERNVYQKGRKIADRKSTSTVLPDGNPTAVYTVTVRLKSNGSFGIRFDDAGRNGKEFDFDFYINNVGDTTNRVYLVVATGGLVDETNVKVVGFVHHVSSLKGEGEEVHLLLFPSLIEERDLGGNDEMW